MPDRRLANATVPQANAPLPLATQTGEKPRTMRWPLSAQCYSASLRERCRLWLRSARFEFSESVRFSVNRDDF